MSRNIINTHHPLKGKAGLLHTTDKNLNGKRFLVADSIACLPVENRLIEELIERASRLTRYPLTAERIENAKQRILLGFLGGSQEGVSLLVDEDEVLHREHLMTSQFNSHLAVARTVADRVVEALDEIVNCRRDYLRQPSLARHLQSAAQIQTLIAGKDVLYEAEGIESLLRALTISRNLHTRLSGILNRKREECAIAGARFHDTFGWMKHGAHHKLVSGEYAKDGYSPDYQMNFLIEKLSTLVHDPSLIYGPIPSTTYYLQYSLTFAHDAKALFDWTVRFERLCEKKED